MCCGTGASPVQGEAGRGRGGGTLKVYPAWGLVRCRPWVAVKGGVLQLVRPVQAAAVSSGGDTVGATYGVCIDAGSDGGPEGTSEGCGPALLAGLEYAVGRRAGNRCMCCKSSSQSAGRHTLGRTAPLACPIVQLYSSATSHHAATHVLSASLAATYSGRAAALPRVRRPCSKNGHLGGQMDGPRSRLTRDGPRRALTYTHGRADESMSACGARSDPPLCGPSRQNRALLCMAAV